DDDWGIKAGSKKAYLVFARSKFIESQGSIKFSIRSDEPDDFRLVIAVNGKPRSHILLGGKDAARVGTLEIDIDESDFRSNEIMEVSFDSSSRWASLFGKPKVYVLHSAHIYGLDEKADQQSRVIERQVSVP